MPARRAAAGTGTKRARPGGAPVTGSVAPSLDVTKTVVAPEAAAADMGLGREAEERHYRETLAGDVKRAMGRGTSTNTDVWSPWIAYAIPKTTHEPCFKEYEESFMQPRPEFPPCRLGRLCQGHTLTTLLPAPCGGFTLPVFKTLKGTTFSGLCVLCLKVAWTRDVHEGRAWQPVKGMRPFKLTELEYGAYGTPSIMLRAPSPDS